MHFAVGSMQYAVCSAVFVVMCSVLCGARSTVSHPQDCILPEVLAKDVLEGDQHPPEGLHTTHTGAHLLGGTAHQVEPLVRLLEEDEEDVDVLKVVPEHSHHLLHMPGGVVVTVYCGVCCVQFVVCSL